MARAFNRIQIGILNHLAESGPIRTRLITGDEDERDLTIENDCFEDLPCTREGFYGELVKLQEYGLIASDPWRDGYSEYDDCNHLYETWSLTPKGQAVLQHPLHSTSPEAIASRRSLQVFVSYSHRDKATVAPFVRAVAQGLAFDGIGVFFDETDRPTEDVDGLAIGLSRPLSTSAVLLAFVSPDYVKSRWCREEFNTFVNHHIAYTVTLDTGNTPSQFHFPVVLVSTDAAGLSVADRLNVLLPQLESGWLCSVDNAAGLCSLLVPTPEAIRRVQDAVVTATASEAGSPSPEVLQSPEEIWSMFAQRRTARVWPLTVNIAELLQGFSPPSKLNRQLCEKIEEHMSPDVVRLFENIKSLKLTAFARQSSVEFSRLLPETLGIPQMLFTNQHDGPALVILMDLAESFEINMPMIQYSYYHCTFDRGRDPCIDTAAMAALALSFDFCELPLHDAAEFLRLIVRPLTMGTDVGSDCGQVQGVESLATPASGADQAVGQPPPANRPWWRFWGKHQGRPRNF